MKAHLAAALPAFALLAACDTGFAPQYRIQDLRILAVRAQVQGTPATADALPGDTLQLEALVVNPQGLPGLAVTWYGCLPPASEALSPCADPELLSDPARLPAAANDPASGVLRLGACTPAAGADRCSIAFAVPGPADPEGPLVQAALDFVQGVALAEPAFRCRLYAELPVVAVAEAGGARRLAVKRVRITERPERLDPALRDYYVVNLNPTAEDVTRAPAGSGSCAGAASLDPSSLPAGESVLCGARGGTSQDFNVCDEDGNRERVAESADWQWYATAGEFPEFEGVGNATGSPVDFVRPRSAFTLWAILRDGRGGEDWLRRDVAPLP
jgi:hypothetical protein